MSREPGWVRADEHACVLDPGQDVEAQLAALHTEAGLVAAEVWPSSDTVAERLITALEALLDETPEGSPKRSRITAALGALKDLSVGTGGNVLGQVIGGALGLIQ